MPVNISVGELRPELETLSRTAAKELGEGLPFRIGILGDFRGSGRTDGSSSTQGGRQRGWVTVDRDNIDEVMARLGVSLKLDLDGVQGAPITVTFEQLEDFHPDRILERAEPFRSLLEMRRRLEQPATFAAAAAELAATARAEAHPTVSPPASPDLPPKATSPPVVGSSAELLDLILDQKQGVRTEAPVVAPHGVTELVAEIAAPYIVHSDARQAGLIACVDAAMTVLLLKVLHHPEFQALESAWRGIHFLIRRLDTGPTLTIDLIDTTREALAGDLISKTPLESTATYKRLVESTVGTEGGQPWALLIGNFTFAPVARDVALLWRLGKLARLAGAPFVATADSRFVGCASLAQTPHPDDWVEPTIPEGWAALRQSPEAPYMGLALPRFLLRAPYGPESTPVHTFTFQEMTELPAHESYLWGNPALAVALLMGRAFAASGWSWRQSYDYELEGLPLVVERSEGEAVAKPCAEASLPRRAVDRILESGLMPLVSIQDRDAVQLAELRSLAYPPCALAVREAST